MILTPITGNVSYLIFVVRSQAPVGENMYNFLPISSFGILNSSQTNITGGQMISSKMALQVLPVDWVKSSYLSENTIGTSTDFKANP